MVRRFSILAIVGIVFAAVQAQEIPSIDKAWVRESPPGSVNGAAYFLVNGSEADDRLIGVTVSADIADRAELHTHKHEAGMMKMEKVDAIDIPAGGQATLKPHGDHVMLIGLKRLLKEGETIVLELQFGQAGTISIDAPVLRDAPTGHSH